MDGHRVHRYGCTAIVFALVAALMSMRAQEGTRAETPTWQTFLAAASADRPESDAALAVIASSWRDGYAAPLIEVARFLPSPRADSDGVDSDDAPLVAPSEDRGDVAIGRRIGSPLRVQTPEAAARQSVTTFLQKQTGQRFGDDLRAWRRWLWSNPPDPPGDYATFKAELYGRIDPRFRLFFPPEVQAAIRLDEVDWGGVGVNGIPPLRAPRHISAHDAAWLRDNHLVFGIEVDGEARAYPKRILAWHELALDRLGGVDLTIVYCTLCGTVIPYESGVGSRRFVFGTSGLLYRSNKLMFDEETGSLWSALDGAPVVGPLVGSGLRLPFRTVVTTTWGEWRRDHPDTTVLSIDTGYERNYAEGAAYREYFATDRLMFEVPTHNRRLRNKAEVLVVRSEVLGGDAPPVAIAVDRLRREPLFSFDVGDRGYLVVTSPGGANRVYERGAYTFSGARPRGRDRAVIDDAGGEWTVTPAALVRRTGERLPSVPSHRAFWFGWIAQYPDTRLFD